MFARIRIPTVDGPSLTSAVIGLQLENEQWLRAHPGTPALYASGVRYRREPPGREEWEPIPVVLTKGWGDCEDLASWRAAELRVTGEDPHARVHVYQSAPTTWHVVVRRGDGSIEDPSRKLGMRGRG